MALFSLAASHIGIAMGGSERWESDWSPFTTPKGICRRKTKSQNRANCQLNTHRGCRRCRLGSPAVRSSALH